VSTITAWFLIGRLVTTLLMDNGGLCNYLEDVLSAERHPLGNQAMFCTSLLIYSATLLSLSVSRMRYLCADCFFSHHTSSMHNLLPSGITRGCGSPRMTPSRGVIPEWNKKNLWLNLERTLDKRGWEVGVVTRRQLKAKKMSLCRQRWLKKVASFFRKQ